MVSRRCLAMSFLSRRPNGSVTPPPPVEEGPEGWPARYPALVEFLTAAVWPDGSPRAPGTLTLFCEAGAWKACLNDKDQSLVSFCTAPSPSQLLLALEGGLETDNLDWRSTKGFQRGKR
jgi:hypothetical protein